MLASSLRLPLTARSPPTSSSAYAPVKALFHSLFPSTLLARQGHTPAQPERALWVPIASLPLLRGLGPAASARYAMASKAAGGDGAGTPPVDPTKVRELVQKMVNSDPRDGWDETWRQSLTPWDLGAVTPAVAGLIRSGAIPEEAKTVLVPGCGTGYDVVAFAEGGKRRATGLDISETALAKAKETALGQPGYDSVTFVKADFFEYTPEAPFDVIFDYTFFCAISPSLRKDWAKKTAANLAPNGTLFTLVFPIGTHEGGPPYAVSREAYEDVLAPLGLVSEELPTVSHPQRQGKEILLKWTRKA